MKRKVLALLSALTVMVAGSMTAFAASPTVPSTEAPAPGQVATTVVSEMKTATEYTSVTQVSEGFSVTTVTQTVIQSVAVTVQNQLLNNLSSIGALFQSAASSITQSSAGVSAQPGSDSSIQLAASSYSSIAEAAEDSTKRVTASVLSVVDVNAETAAKTDNGNYVVTLNIANIASTDAIAVLHYTGSAWETIIPTSVANGSVTFETASLSPISIVKLEVESLTAAPKTGQEAAAMPFVMAAAGLAGAIFCGKKYFG